MNRAAHFRLVRYALAGSLAAIALPVAAQFMKPGPTPESGFAGTWRVTAAETAPWEPVAKAKPGKPLLEYAVKFSDGEAKGPPALACVHATFSSGVTAPDDLFDGRLKSTRAASKLALTDAAITTFRVVCDGRTRNYYIDANANLKTYEGGVIYTLERPTGMEIARYEPGYSGPSFDCAKAISAGEHAICWDATLSSTDRRLNAAFRRLKTTETPASFLTVQTAQRAWLNYVTRRCRAGGPLLGDTGEQQTVTLCLTDQYTDRADQLESSGVLKAGALALESRMSLFTRSRPDTLESDIYPWMTGGREADAFNAYVAKTLKLGQRRMDDKDLFPFGDDVADMKLSAQRTYHVQRFDDRIVSVQIQTFDYTGGAHEVIGESSLNWDVKHARAFTLKDVFDDATPWRKFATDFCMRDLHDQLAAEQAPDPDRSAVESVVGDDANWLWGTDGATVHFSVYTVASFSGGEFDVDIPYTELDTYLRPRAKALLAH